MKLLNPHALPKVPFIPADGRVRVLRVRGRPFALDENTLALYELDGGDLPAPEPARPNYVLSTDLTLRMLVLLPTDSCNLNCRYCFARPPDRGTSMSREVARRALALFPPRRDINVSFFGGEPLLEFGIIREAVEEAESLAGTRNVRARFHVTTNGTLVTDEIARFLGEHRFSAIVSLDGDRATHDPARPLRSSRGSSYDLALAGLEKLTRFKGRGPRRITLRATFDATSPNVLERLLHLNALAREGLADSVSVEPACVSEGCAAGLGFSRADMKGLRREYARCAGWFVEEIASGRRPLFFHFSKMLSRLVTRALAPSTCGAGRGCLTVGPDGRVYACHRTNGSHLGHVGALDESLRAPWLDNRWYACGKCRECWARNLCGGVCRADSFERSGRLLSPDAVSCAIKRMWMTEAMWILSECERKGLTAALKGVLGIRGDACCGGKG